MNKFIIAILFLFIYKSCFPQIGGNEILITNNIRYLLNISDYKDYKSFGKQLFDLLTDTNNIKNYQCYTTNPIDDEFLIYEKGNKPEKLNNQEKFKSIANNDTFNAQIFYPPYDFRDTVINYNYRIDSTQIFQFTELWSFDTLKIKFYKRVMAIAPEVKEYKVSNGSSFLNGFVPIYWIKLNQKNVIDSSVYLKYIQYDVKIISCEKACNWNPFNNIEPTERYKFLKFIFSGICSGKIKAYKDSLKKELMTCSLEDLPPYFPFYADSLKVKYFGYDDTFITYYKGGPGLVNTCRFYEEWIFDNKNQYFKKKVSAMAFIMDNLYESESKVSSKPLFWIFFN